DRIRSKGPVRPRLRVDEPGARREMEGDRPGGEESRPRGAGAGRLLRPGLLRALSGQDLSAASGGRRYRARSADEHQVEHVDEDPRRLTDGEDDVLAIPEGEIGRASGRERG